MMIVWMCEGLKNSWVFVLIKVLNVNCDYVSLHLMTPLGLGGPWQRRGGVTPFKLDHHGGGGGGDGGDLG